MGKKTYKIRHMIWLVFTAVVISLLPVFSVTVQAAEPVNQQTVKVGFFSSDGYHVIDADGTKSGYGFDFLQMLLRYHDWNYEYVGYDKNWGDMLDMLDSGEIDMVTLADQTPERLEKYSFSTKPIGTSCSILTVSSDNESIVPGEYDTYDGARIGLVSGSSHNEAFESYAAEKGFTYTPVYYEDIDDMLTDLRAGEKIDIALTSNMRIATDEIILDEFNAHNFYVMVKKGNEKLLEQVNDGIDQLNVYSPNWQTILFEKYYSNINENVISFSTDERAYLKGLKETNTIIKVAMNPELKPYSYFEDGEAKGIAPTIFREIADRLGIQYEILESKDRWEYKEQLNSGEAQVDLTAYLDYSIAEKYDLEETDAYITSTLAMLQRGDSNTDEDSMVVAVVRDPTEYAGYNNDLIYKYHYVEYESVQECIDAVKNKEADVTFRYVYIAEQAVADDYTNQLQYRILQGDSFGLCMGVHIAQDHRLLSILNKGVNSLSESYVQGVMLQETTQNQSETSLLAVAYDHPVWVLVVVVVILFIIVVFILLIVRTRYQKNKLFASIEMERFIGYMCETYEHIAEVDLDKMQQTEYELQDGKLMKTVREHEPFSKEYFAARVQPEDVELMTERFSVAKIDQMIAEGGSEEYFECKGKDETGAYIWYSYIMKAVPKDAAHSRNYIVFKKNIQESKLSEEQAKQVLKDALANAQKASMAKGAFVSKISHEIRTPLNAIIGYLNMAEEDTANEEKVEHCIKNGKLASEHLLDLINDVLDNSAIESNRLKIASEEFDLKDLLTSMAAIYYNQAEQKGVQFSIQLKNIIEEKMMGDALRVKQILVNLLSNASKFTDAGGSITLRVEQVKQTDKTTHIQFQVEDTGMGMEEGFLAHIFEAFEQEDATIARKYGGSGLGMSITKNLVDLMNGSIQVVSKKNVGTTFTVVLPFARVDEAGRSKKGENLSGVRVLVIEEEEQSVNYAKDLFKRCGVKCDVITSREKALKRLVNRIQIETPYQLCVVDWKDSKESMQLFTQQIVETCQGQKPYILALTYDVDMIADAAKETGIDEVVTKPLFQSTMYDFLVTKFGTGTETVKRQEPEREEGLKGIHVLLAEDNEMNMEIAQHILGKAGMIVTPATNGREAYERFLKEEEHTFDAILMDMQMPEMDGCEATRAIRNSIHPRAKTIPIIALTANAFAEDISTVLNAGMNDHVAKPIDEKKLYHVLKKFI